MFARKLSRLAGLVFVLAAFIGGAGAFDPGVWHETGGTPAVVDGSGAPSVQPDSTVVAIQGVDWA